MSSLKIAFVSSHPSILRFRNEASFIYRCENLAAAVRGKGHHVSLVHLSTLLFFKRFDVAVFLRPRASWLFNFAVRRLRAKGTVLIGDVDDLIFDAELAGFRPSVRNNMADYGRTRNKFISHARALGQLDKVQFSTKNLVRHYLKVRPDAQCCVIPNTAFHAWNQGDSRVEIGSEVRITYFSGTRTHDRDFAIVLPVLLRLLGRHQNLVVQVVGPVAVELEHPRVRRIGKVSFAEYDELVRTGHICVVPLEDTPFNQCKSAVKAVEAGAMNVPIVASAVGEYAEISMCGVILARSEEEWESSLEYLLDPLNYSKASAGLAKRMRSFADPEKAAQTFLDFAC